MQRRLKAIVSLWLLACPALTQAQEATGTASVSVEAGASPTSSATTPEAPAPEAAPASEAAPPESAPPPPTMSPVQASAEAPPPPFYPVPPPVQEPEEEEGAWNPWDHPERAGSQTHDGFFLRLSLGLGGGRVRGTSDPYDGSAVTFAGIDFGGSIAVGGSVVENFAVHADYFFSSVLDASTKGGLYDSALGRDLGFSYDGDVGMHALGMGVTYYFTPINIYLAGAVGLATTQWERSDGQRDSSRLGVAGQLMVGKEWWVDHQWGLGLALQLMGLTARDVYYERVRGSALNLLFSVTYN